MILWKLSLDPKVILKYNQWVFFALYHSICCLGPSPYDHARAWSSMGLSGPTGLWEMKGAGEEDEEEEEEEEEVGKANSWLPSAPPAPLMVYFNTRAWAWNWTVL